MKKKLFSLFLLIGIIIVLGACGKKEIQPVAINEDTDICEVCNMAVIDNQFATQVVMESGKSMAFDDVGCMYDWLENNNNEDISAKFVRDYNDEEWISVDEATYIHNLSVKTPMAYNVISFKDKASAEKFANENEGSQLMTVDDLAEHKWEQNQDMMKEHNIEEHSHDTDSGHSEDSDEHNQENHNDMKH